MLGCMNRRMAHGEVVGRRDVPQPDSTDVQHHRRGRVSDESSTALELGDLTGHGTQDHLREAEDGEDRGQVKQQHVLDHVGEEQLIGEAVDRGYQRCKHDQHRSQEAEQPPHGRLVCGARRAA